MQKAEIIGDNGKKIGDIENPTLYSTIINPHPTLTLTTDKIENIKIPESVQTDSSFTGNLNKKGKMSIPIKLESSDPNFISIQESKIPNNKFTIDLPKIPLLSPTLHALTASDAKKIKTKLNNSKNNKERKNALNAEKQRLKNDAKQISQQISLEINKLINAKRYLII